ncbi:MAG TPA: MFS transporter, partial [Acidocella sp.]|nr:MFS transporter [Acidocella sp.]
FLENLGNYPVATAGLVMAPRGIGTMFAMLVAGRLTNKIDPRLLMLLGYLLLGLSLYMQEGWTPMESEFSMMETIIIQGAGLGFVFVPLQVVAFYTMSPELRTQGTSLLSLVRNVGSAIGISLTSALLARQIQYEHADLAQFITPFTRTLQTGGPLSKMLDPGSRSGASLLNAMIDTQAQIIAYIDDYKFLLITTIPAIACLLLMRRPPVAVPNAPATGHAVMD